MEKILRFFIIVVVLAGAAPASRAAFEDTSSGARMRGMAGAFTAVADDSEAVFSQPAGLAQLQGPEAAFSYGRLYWGLTDDSGLHNGIFSFAAPFSRFYGAGFGYRNLSLDGSYTEESIVGSFAVRPIPEVAVGVSAQYLTIRYGTDAYTAVDPLFARGTGVSAFDWDAGVLLRPVPSFSVGYVRHSMAEADLGIAGGAPRPSCDSFALAYREDGLTVALENVRRSARSQFLAGVEAPLLRDTAVLRTGFGWGDNDFRKVTSGIGFSFRQYRIDYAFEYPLGGIEKTSGTHYLSLSIRLNTVQRSADEKQAALPVTAGIEAPAVPAAEIALSTSAALQELPAVSSAPAAAPLPVSTTASLLLPGLELTQDTTAPVEILPPAIDTAPAVAPLPQEAEPDEEEDTAPAAPSVLRAKPLVPAVSVEKKPAVRTHRVAAGDTLPGLAEKYYGTKALWTKIYEANKDRIEKGTLQPGQQLIIP